MAEKALYEQLTKYNEKVSNTYKNNWGSVLSFLGGHDTEALATKSDQAMLQTMGNGNGSGIFATTSSNLHDSSQGKYKRNGFVSKFRSKKQPFVITRDAVLWHDKRDSSLEDFRMETYDLRTRPKVNNKGTEYSNLQFSNIMSATQDNLKAQVGFKTARIEDTKHGQRNVAIDYLQELQDECQTASRDELVNRNNLLEQLDINSLGLLEQALLREDVSATLGKTSVDSADADLLKPSVNQFKGRDNQVASHLESGRQISLLHNNLTSAKTQTNSAVRRAQMTSTSVGYSSSFKGPSSALRKMQPSDRADGKPKQLIHELMSNKHQASSRLVRDCLMREYQRNRSTLEQQKTLTGVRDTSARNPDHYKNKFLHTSSGALHINPPVHGAPSMPESVMGTRKLEAVKEILTPELQPGSARKLTDRRRKPRQKQDIEVMSIGLSNSFESQSHEGHFEAVQQPKQQQVANERSRNANQNLYNTEEENADKLMPSKQQPIANSTRTPIGLHIDLEKPTLLQFGSPLPLKSKYSNEQQTTMLQPSSVPPQLSPPILRGRHFPSQADIMSKDSKTKSYRTGLKYQPGMLFGNDDNKYFQTGGNYKYQLDEEAQTYFNSRKDLIQEVVDKSKVGPNAKNAKRNLAYASKSYNQFKTAWYYSQNEGSLAHKPISIAKEKLSFNLEQHQLDEIRKGFMTSKADPNSSQFVDLVTEPRSLRHLKQSLEQVGPRVEAKQDPDRTTAFGFPTIHQQNPVQQRRLRIQAGAPQDNLTSVTGEVMKHTRQIENETLVTKNNPLQYCVKLYDYEEKKSEQLANGGRVKNMNQRDGQTQGGAASSNQTKQIYDFQPYDIVNLSETLSTVHQTSNENGPRVVPARPEEKVIFNTKRRLLNETVGEKQVELYQRQQRADYSIGSRRKFGDDFAKSGPIKYLSAQRQEKWLEKRAPISSEQLQQMRKIDLLAKQNMHNSFDKSVETKKPSKKATQKKQLQVAQELFLIWDGDGEGSLSADELMKAFIQIGLSQDPRFARKIMQNIRPQQNVARGVNAQQQQSDEDSDGNDIELKDFIKIFKKDDVSDNLVKVINEQVIMKRKLAMRKATKAMFERQDITKNEQHPTSIEIISNEVGSNQSRIDSRDTSEEQNVDLEVQDIMQFGDDSMNQIKDPSIQITKLDQKQQVTNTSSLFHKSLMSGNSYKVDTGSHGMTLFNNKFADQKDVTRQSEQRKSIISKDGELNQKKSEENQNFRKDSTILTNAMQNKEQVIKALLNDKMQRTSQALGVPSPEKLDVKKCGGHHHQVDFYATEASRMWKLIGTEGIASKRSELLKTPTLGEQNDIIQDWWKQIVKSYLKEVQSQKAQIPSSDSQREKAVQPQIQTATDEIPLAKVYDLLIKKRLVTDKQGAISLIQQQIGTNNLQTQGKMCQDEFSKLFSKGQFQTTLINTINKLQEQPQMGKQAGANKGLVAPPAWSSMSRKKAKSNTPAKALIDDSTNLLKKMAESLKSSIAVRKYIDEDAKLNFAKEVPLSLKIERYQRQKLLQGLKPERDQEQREQFKFLQSLKYIQKYEPDDIDPVTKYLRQRPYEEYIKDPLGTKYKETLEDQKQFAMTDHFNKRIDFVKLENEVKEGFKEWQDYHEAEKKQWKLESQRGSQPKE